MKNFARYHDIEERMKKNIDVKKFDPKEALHFLQLL